LLKHSNMSIQRHYKPAAILEPAKNSEYWSQHTNGGRENDEPTRTTNRARVCKAV